MSENIDATDNAEAIYKHSATYCPEDNKIRLYPDWDDPEFDKETVKAAGFRWASKQECYVCPKWSVKAEDAALMYCDDIDDEEKGPEERAADRAERFAGYREKRRGEAGELADRYDAGPDAYGHQSQQRAERAAARRDRTKGRALSQWSKAEYWQRRTAGVIAHALHKSSPRLRRARIKKLEAEQRQHLKLMETRRERFAGWQKVLTLDGGNCTFADCKPPEGYHGVDLTKATPALELAYKLSNVSECRSYAYHPDDATEYHSTYELLSGVYKDGERLRQLTPHEVAALVIGDRTECFSETGSSNRWAKHYEFRLAYENAMLENEGGAAFNDVIEVGYVTTTGVFQVTKVNKSAASGKVVSVSVVNTETWEEGGRVNIERMKSGQFQPPTEAQSERFKEWQKASKAKAKATAPRKPQLINPTPEDAEKLQALFNARYKDESKHAKPIHSTQAAYSSQSKGSYGKCETVVLGEKMRPIGRYEHETTINTQRREVVKVRIYRNGFNADRVVIIDDKPQKPIPWELFAELRALEPTEETHGQAFADLWETHGEWGYDFANLPEDQRAAARQLRKDAGYLGWAKIQCCNEFQLTEEGRAVRARWSRSEVTTH